MCIRDRFSIVQDKVRLHKDLVDHFRARYWNEEIQRKVCVQLEFGKYVLNKGSKEKYLGQLVLKAKHLELTMSEDEIVKKLAHHFNRRMQVAVITQGFKTRGIAIIAHKIGKR